MNDYTLRTFRAFATKKLQGVSATPDLDVQVLLQHAMHYDKTQLLLFADNHRFRHGTIGNTFSWNKRTS